MKNTARSIAFETLARVYKDGAYTNIALQHALTDRELSPRDKGLCTEIVYGTVRRQITIDALLQLYVKRKLKDLDQDVLTILRMSVYQLAFLERVPAYAAIDEAVELTKRHARAASGFVNGVLRSYVRESAPTEDKIQAFLAKKRANEVLSLGVRHGFPNWMVQRLMRAYGRERAEAILAACNEPAPLTVRANLLKTTRESLRTALVEATQAQVRDGELSAQALVIPAAVNVETLEQYRAGQFTIQDEAAMLIAPLLTPLPGSSVLDMCAAPGGKTTHIAELMRDEGTIDAYDVYLQKVKMIQQQATRLGLKSVTARLGDGRDFAQKEAAYDAVLVDAPCSGLGVMRRRPDIRHRRKQSDIEQLTSLQRELLTAAMHAVRPGGIVVYATCTLLPEENERVVEWVQRESSDAFVVEDIHELVPEVFRQDVHHGLTITPERVLTDGFYMTRLRKK
ncbi:16S rRNA (cytosine(967)-C(5))-methyltransferase RsmB [Alicyclobacillus fastidiosus]|uniref:16S rRNA (cytosine(967)-C(5))-methyltransferase n=1 Tax=Alicyclobacillus fastidiosus TaxID=392011 RepID=A0ABY6ZE40_9BACL|nr:16S rRNA (cytosine(967)-C(5))-methyltransferase RsmB [Alicyclobacillus fastidiosus]WAH40400.1 16S rRNA (cytosine(967)-C(5))-methyltransferase RsmB [Alicyclobacillus fastidiosus]GMA61792.1 16S rRNA (cytosine(967)-C(5))-methyltransferase [Alicyclobacillus fastidiosus]